MSAWSPAKVFQSMSILLSSWAIQRGGGVSMASEAETAHRQRTFQLGIPVRFLRRCRASLPRRLILIFCKGGFILVEVSFGEVADLGLFIMPDQVGAGYKVLERA